MGLQCRQFIFEGKTFSHYYLCNYKPVRAGADKMSQSLVKFKQGVQFHVDAWSECAVQELVKNNLASSDKIIRARSSAEFGESKDDDSPLSLLCRKLANAVGGVYEENLLLKTRATVPLKGLSLRERELEMKDVYQFNADKLKQFKNQSIMLVDDIYTSGTTVRAILRALLLFKAKLKVTIFTLAYTDYAAELNKQNTFAAGPYQFVPDIGWSMVAESDEHLFELPLLKRMILTDNFQ